MSKKVDDLLMNYSKSMRISSTFWAATVLLTTSQLLLTPLSCKASSLNQSEAAATSVPAVAAASVQLPPTQSSLNSYRQQSGSSISVENDTSSSSGGGKQIPLVRLPSNTLLKYTAYKDVSILHFRVPMDTRTAQFSFKAYEESKSAFSKLPVSVIYFSSLPSIKRIFSLNKTQRTNPGGSAKLKFTSVN